jgi:hypothetical protein
MSSYCLTPAMKEGRKTIYDVIDFAVENGCEHIEFVPFYLPFVDEEKKVLNYSLIDSVRDKCRSVNLEISTYSVNADIQLDFAVAVVQIAKGNLPHSSFRHQPSGDGYRLSFSCFKLFYNLAAFCRYFIFDLFKGVFSRPLQFQKLFSSHS